MIQCALYILVSAVKLAGPSSTYRRSNSSCNFASLLYTSTRKVRSFKHIHHNNIISAKMISKLPSWASALYSSSGLSTSVPISIAWARYLSCSRRYHHRALPTNPSGELLSGVLSTKKICSYTTTELSKADDVMPLSLSRVAIPAPGHRPISIMRFLPWPWSEIFSPSGFKALTHSYRSKLVDSVPMYDSFASEQDRVDIYKALQSRGMLKFRTTTPRLRALPINGMFGLRKYASKDRILVDERPGNFSLLTMKEIQS